MILITLCGTAMPSPPPPPPPVQFINSAGPCARRIHRGIGVYPKIKAKLNGICIAIDRLRWMNGGRDRQIFAWHGPQNWALNVWELVRRLKAMAKACVLYEFAMDDLDAICRIVMVSFFFYFFGWIALTARHRKIISRYKRKEFDLNCVSRFDCLAAIVSLNVIYHSVRELKIFSS